MEDGILLEKLMGFGLTRQEAVLYLSLYRNGGMTGYEASKLTGISRSNVYNSLTGLVEKGAAYKREGAASKYVAVDVDDFCKNRIRRMEEDREYLSSHVLRPETESEGYLTVEGPRHIRDKAVNMLSQAQYRIYLLAPASLIESIRQELEELIESGKKVVVLAEKDPGLLGSFFYRKENVENQLRLIVDSSYVLTGEAGEKQTDTCLYTGQKNFVSVFKEALRNEIKLIELTESRNGPGFGDCYEKSGAKRGHHGQESVCNEGTD